MILLLQIFAELFLAASFVAEAASHGIRSRMLYGTAWETIERYERMWHTFNAVFIALITGAVITLYVAELQRYDSIAEWYLFSNEMYIDILVVGFQVALARFVYFAPLRNLIAWKPITYIGNSAVTDSFLRKYVIQFISPQMIFLSRIFGLIVLIVFQFA